MKDGLGSVEDVAVAKGLVRDSAGQFNRKHFTFSFGLKNHLSFGLRFLTLKTIKKWVV